MARDEFYIQCRSENKWECANPLDNVIFLRDEYEKYWNKIKNGDNFAFLRYGIEELALMVGREITAPEGWHAGPQVTALGRKLRETLVPPSDGMVYGIPCPCCHSEGYYWYLRHLEQAAISFADLWINGNFQQFLEDFAGLDREAVLITNQAGLGKTYGNLRIKKHYVVGDDCVAFWDSECEALIERIAFEVDGEDGLLYVVSAGPLSKVIIWELFKRNPKNCYIDFGSALDPFIHGKITRPLMVGSSPHAKKNCWMFEPGALRTDVDVVLTAYKRPEVLKRQLDAVLNQTLRPKRVLLYQDGIDSYYSIRFSDEILQQFDDYSISSTNGGVWKRFEYAMAAAESKYVCIFDDDTIPGNRWLENCHMNIMQHSGVYGTNGILLSNLEYPYGGGGIHIGWHVPNAETSEADFVGHSWFLETEWLKWMLKKKYKDQYKYVGEDMCLSFSCAENRIKTYVPAHPAAIYSLWGSIPKYGNAYGVNAAAVHMNEENLSAMHNALQQYHKDGWHPIFEEDGGYIAKMRLNVMRSLYSGGATVEANEELESIVINSMRRFREARRRHDVWDMASALLAAKSVLIIASMRESVEKTEFKHNFLRVFLLGTLYAIRKNNHSLSLVYLTAIEEAFFALGQPEPGEILFYKGLVYYFRQEYATSEKYFLEYLVQFPRNEEAFFCMGNAAVRQNALERAVEAYTHALSIRENYKEVACNVDFLVSASTQGMVLSPEAGEFEDDFRRHSLSMDGKDVLDLPIFIRVKNQLAELEKLLTWFLEAGHRNIYILDNASTHPPLLEYYNSLAESKYVRVLYMKKDLGDDALWGSGVLNVLHISTPYVYAKADSIPSEKCSKDLVKILLEILKQYPFLSRVDLGTEIKPMVDGTTDCDSEMQKNNLPIGENVYFGSVESKIALYRNCYHNDNFSTAWTGGNLRTTCSL